MAWASQAPSIAPISWAATYGRQSFARGSWPRQGQREVQPGLKCAPVTGAIVSTRT